MTHAASIQLFNALGADFTPELKALSIEMPFGGFSQADYAQKLINKLKAADVHPSRVWVQFFNIENALYRVEKKNSVLRLSVWQSSTTSKATCPWTRPHRPIRWPN